MSDLTDPLAGNRMQAPEVADQQPNAPLSPPSWLERLPSNDNPFAARLREDPSLGSVSLADRASLAGTSAFYDTLRGVARLNTLDSIARGAFQPSGPGSADPTPENLNMAPEDAAAEAARIRRDLARYEVMPGFEGPLEGTAAFAGQLAGGMMSPESWITKFRGVRWAIGKVIGEAAPAVASRILDAAMSQGVINTLSDPLTQVGRISADLQDGWNPVRTAMAFPVGAATGGVLQGAGEAVGAAATRVGEWLAERASRAAFEPTAQRIARERLYPPQPGEGEIDRLAAEDPSLKTSPPPGAPPAPPAEVAPRPPEAVPPEAAPVEPGAAPAAEAAPGAAAAPEPVPGAPAAPETMPAAPPRQFQAVEDPLVLAQRGELTADRAAEIRDELSAAPPETLRGAPEHVDPEIWTVIARNLHEAETSRQGGIAVVADQMRYLPDDGVPKNISEREAAAVIARALDAEATRGGDVGSFLADADAAYRAAGHGTPPDVTAAEAARAAAESRLAAGLVGEPVAAMPAHRVATAGGDSVEVTPIVVEARDLIASNDPGYDPALQPRQRDRAASQQQVREMASRLDPERLGVSAEADRGAPIIGDDRMVESGNGRVMAIRAAYAADGPAAAAYREFLSRQGVDVSGYDQPVLVRQRTTPMSPEERAAFGRDANQPATLSMSAPERAMADARNLTPDMLDLIRNPDNLEALANRDFVRAFVESLPQAEQGAMTTAEGALSAEGQTRIRHAVLARAYGGTPDGAAILSRITESSQDEIRSISNALTAAAPQWSRLRADIEAGRVVPEVDLTPELLEAVRRTADLRNRGQSFSDFLRQRDAFDALPPRVEMFMSLFYDAKGTRAAGGPRIADGLKEYAIEASKVSAEPGLDLGLPAVSADELQRRIVERARGGGGGDTGTLFGRERPDQRAGSAGDVARGAERGAQVQRPGAGEPGGGAGGAVQPRARGGVIYTGRERPVATARAAGAGTGAGTGGVSGRVPVRGTPSPAGGAEGEAAVRTLHQQAFDLADAIGFPLRQGRMAKPTFIGQYDSAQDVVRSRAVADFETVSHEAGHTIERHIGPELTDLTNRFAAELAPLDYDPQLGRVNEGFAEWLRHYLTGAPGYAEKLAPTFSPEFRTFMSQKAPAVLAELDRARGAYQAYVNAPTGQKLDAIVQRSEPEGVLHTIRTEGMPRTISLALAHGYQAVFDDKAPVARAVRDLARLYRDASGNRLNLEGSDNPELQVRMFARSHQAAVGDMMDGVRPYHAIEPRGPSLRDALIKATGEPGIFGRWDDAKLKEFSNYLVARRGEVLWAKYNAGELPRRPLAMSEAEVKTAIAEAEAVNPSFAAAASMVHDYTRELLTKQFEGGLIDRELFDKMMKEPFYVPLYRRMDDKPMLAGDRPTAGGAEGPGMVNLIRRQTGSDRDIIDPIQGLMTQTFLVERTVAHNDIIKSFDALAQQARSAGATGVGRIVERVPAHEVKAMKFDVREGIENAARQAGIDPDDTKVLMGAIADTFGQDPIMASVFRRQPTGPRGEPIIFYKDGGELKALRLIADAEGRALYETLTSLPPVIRDWAIGLGAASATALRTGIVANPVFALTNFVRDQLAAAILRPGTIPFNPRGLFREISGDRYAQMYSAAGGVSPGSQAVGLTEMLVDRSIDELARKGWAVQKVGALGDLVTRGKVLGALKAIGETVELGESGTRLNVMKSVFDQKKRQGLSDYDAMLEAAYQATDMLDFGRHGSKVPVIRTLIPFINAHMQALDKASRTLFQPLWRAARGDLVTQADANSVKNAALSWGLIGVSAGLGAAYATWAASHEAYHDANDELRATHLIIPGDAFGYPGKILLVPKPFELAIGFNLGEMLGLGIATGDPRLAGFAVGGVQEVLVPPNVLNSIPGLKTYAELALNRSFFTRRDIVPQRLQALTPAEQWIPGQTSTMARQVGSALGISPIKVDYAIGNTFGLWGKDLLAASNTADPNAAAPALENQMFLRRFIKGADVASETTKRFWTLAGQQTGEYAQAKNTYDSMIRDFREKDAAAFLAALPRPERVYVTLQSSGDENGRATFNADEKRMHPLTRAAEAVLTNSAYIRELSGNTQQSIETQERLALDPQHRRQVIDALRVLSAMEQRNALVMVAEPGYAGRKLLSAEDQFRVIKAISPEAADEVAARYAAAKIPPTQTIAQVWPEAQARLLAEGSEAELRDLSYDVRGDGYAFEADRVKRPPKRRLPIAPAPTPSVMTPLPMSTPLAPPPQQPAAAASP